SLPLEIRPEKSGQARAKDRMVPEARPKQLPPHWPPRSKPPVPESGKHQKPSKKAGCDPIDETDPHRACPPAHPAQKRPTTPPQGDADRVVAPHRKPKLGPRKHRRPRDVRMGQTAPAEIPDPAPKPARVDPAQETGSPSPASDGVHEQ